MTDRQDPERLPGLVVRGVGTGVVDKLPFKEVRGSGEGTGGRETSGLLEPLSEATISASSSPSSSSPPPKGFVVFGVRGLGAGEGLGACMGLEEGTSLGVEWMTVIGSSSDSS